MKNTYSICFLLAAIIVLPFVLSDAQNPEGERKILIFGSGGGAPAAHAPSHTDGSDDIQNATAAQKGLATATQITKLDGIEALADITDTANVTFAGALMDSEVDADIKTFILPANVTISAFGSTLVDDANAATARTTLDVDQAGTDNSTDGFDFVSKNSGADVNAAKRRTLNFIEGCNITITTSDDSGGDEVDITIASTGGSAKAILQIRRTTSLALGTCFATVSFDVTDHETDTSVIQHNDCCIFKIDLKANGRYYVQTGGHVNFTSACGASVQYGHRFLLCCVVQNGSNHPLSPIASICNFTFGGALPAGFFVNVTSAPSVLTLEMDETGGNVNLSAGLTATIQQL